VKSTENTKPIPLRERLWKTIKFIKFRGEPYPTRARGK
jgi:hypothetical protein